LCEKFPASSWRQRRADRCVRPRADPDAIADSAELTSFPISYPRLTYDRNCAGCHGEHPQRD
jgi:hypothetical protein